MFSDGGTQHGNKVRERERGSKTQMASHLKYRHHLSQFLVEEQQASAPALGVLLYLGYDIFQGSP